MRFISGVECKEKKKSAGILDFGKVPLQGLPQTKDRKVTLNESPLVIKRLVHDSDVLCFHVSVSWTNMEAHGLIFMDTLK